MTVAQDPPVRFFIAIDIYCFLCKFNKRNRPGPLPEIDRKMLFESLLYDYSLIAQWSHVRESLP